MKTILYIEDDRAIGEMYVRSLRRQGHTVAWFVDGLEAQDELEAKSYDIILIDIMLPTLRGSDILTHLRETPGPNRHTPVIVMTNFEQDDTSRHQLEQLASAYLMKSETTPRNLLETINYFLSH